MPDASLPPLPPVGQPAWRTKVAEVMERLGVGPLATAVVLVVLALGIGLGSRLLSSSPVAAPAPVTAAAPEPEVEPPTTAPSTVVVDVAGAVARPGLFHLAAGSRVADAIAAAGGPTEEADLRAVNQARTLSDGEQVLVPRHGEVVVPAPSPPRGGGSTKAAGPVDLNRATAEELDALPGVGPSTAEAIVEWRNRNGRFRSVDDLLEVPGIGPAKLERLRDLVTV